VSLTEVGGINTHGPSAGTIPSPFRVVAQVLGLGQRQERTDRVELKVEVYGEPLTLGPAHLRTRSSGMRAVTVVGYSADDSHSQRRPRRALVLVEGMTRGEFQSGEYLEQAQ